MRQKCFGLWPSRVLGILCLGLLVGGLGTAQTLSTAIGRTELITSWEFFPGAATAQDLEGKAGLNAVAPLAMPLLPAGAATHPEGGIYRHRMATSPGATYILSIPGLQHFGGLAIGGKDLFGPDNPQALNLYQFRATGEETDILLRIGSEGASLEDPGLVPRPIMVGPAEGYEFLERVVAGISILQLGYFLLGGLFLLILYFFWPKNKDFLALALFTLVAGAFSLARTGSYFGLSDLPRAWASLVYLFSGALLALAFPNLLAWVFPARLGHKVRIALFSVGALSLLASLSLPFVPSLERVLYTFVYGWLLIGSAITIVWLATRIAAGDTRARWFLPAFIVLVVALSVPRFVPTSIVTVFFLGPAGLVAFVFVTMIMVVRKIGNSFESAEMLTDYVANVSSTMKRFIPREFLECLNKENVTDLRLGDHVKKKMTIFFSDIRAFTELSEKLTVEENFAFINSYLSRMVPILAQNDGFVDKYIGDGIMALFEGDGGPDSAIRAAIAMQEKMVEYNQHRAKTGYRSLAMGVGIHTGDLMLGVIGVDDRMENTVISDAVNLSSRLQAITKAFNIALAISEQSFKELADPGVYKYRFIGKVKVKGKSAPVSVFEIFDGIAPELFERKMKANTYFEQGMLSYYQKDFGGAMYYFKRVLEIIPDDGAAAFYLENCMNKATL